MLPVNDQVSLGKGRTFNEEIGARKGNFSQISRLSMKNQISTRVEYLDIGLTTRLFFFFFAPTRSSVAITPVQISELGS